MAEPQRVGPGFAPVAGPESRVLILGSFPSVKSREVGFYYGHPQNRFWPLLAALLQKPVPQTTAQKQQLILQNGLALWDTVCCCTITGASDASIRDVQPNDIAKLCQTYPITKIFCNGAVSEIRMAANPHSGCKIAQHQPGQRRMGHGKTAKSLGRGPEGLLRKQTVKENIP